MTDKLNKLFVLLAHNSDAGEYNIFRGVFKSIEDAIEGACGYWGDASKVYLNVKHFLIKHSDYYYFIVVPKSNPLTQEQMATMVRNDVVFMCEGTQFIIRQVDVNKYKEYWHN